MLNCKWKAAGENDLRPGTTCQRHDAPGSTCRPGDRNLAAAAGIAECSANEINHLPKRVGARELALELRLSWCDLLTVLGNKGGFEGSLLKTSLGQPIGLRDRNLPTS